MKNDMPTVLKVFFIKEKLDYKGNVITDTFTVDMECRRSFDPSQFIESVLRNGDLSKVGSPTDEKFAQELVDKIGSNLPGFKQFSTWDFIDQFKTIETEPIGAIKFVIKNSNTSMKWVFV